MNTTSLPVELQSFFAPVAAPVLADLSTDSIQHYAKNISRDSLAMEMRLSVLFAATLIRYFSAHPSAVFFASCSDRNDEELDDDHWLNASGSSLCGDTIFARIDTDHIQEEAQSYLDGGAETFIPLDDMNEWTSFIQDERLSLSGEPYSPESGFFPFDPCDVDPIDALGFLTPEPFKLFSRHDVHSHVRSFLCYFVNDSNGLIFNRQALPDILSSLDRYVEHRFSQLDQIGLKTSFSFSTFPALLEKHDLMLSHALSPGAFSKTKKPAL
jgi:hypothetical protein